MKFKDKIKYLNKKNINLYIGVVEGYKNISIKNEMKEYDKECETTIIDLDGTIDIEDIIDIILLVTYEKNRRIL